MGLLRSIFTFVSTISGIFSMTIRILNNWKFNTHRDYEHDEDFVFDLFSISFSWQLRWIDITFFNFIISIGV